jgi:hypothetical protein
MRSTFDLPDELMKRAKIAAIERGSSLRDLVADGLRKVLAEQPTSKRKRMTRAPVKLRLGRTIPLLSNRDIAEVFEREDVAKVHGVYRRR